jgi:putative tricarboxylic transport membrane protein
MLEENFRRSLLLSRGSFTIFVTRPIAGTLIALIGIFVVWNFIVFVRQVRRNRATNGNWTVPAEAD